MLVVGANGARKTVAIPPGSVRNWYREFKAANKVHISLLAQIAKELPEEAKKELKDLLEVEQIQSKGIKGAGGQ